MPINIKKTIKYIMLTIVGSIALFIGVVCYLYVPNPIKITNPYHQWFDPDDFRFEDYMASKCTVKEALAKLLPLGTDKDFVDRVLSKAGGANITKIPEEIGLGPNNYSYFYTPRHWANMFFPHTFNVRVAYDENDRVILMELSGDSSRPSVYTYYQDCKPTKE